MLRGFCGDGVRKDATSQVHVKVAIYKQVIVRVSVQPAVTQCRILFVSSPFAHCKKVSPCSQTEPRCCCLPASTDCGAWFGCIARPDVSLWHKGFAARRGWLFWLLCAEFPSDFACRDVPVWGV